MGSSSSIFTGSSQFSSDFQSIITRATAIASLPISQLNSQKTSLNDQATALTSLDGKFQALQAALDKIEDAISGASFATEISDQSKVGVVLGDGAIEGNYSIEVVDAGTYATSMTAVNWQTGTGAVRSFRLVVGGKTYTLWPTDNTAAGVVSAINSQYGDKVHATVVNVGSSTAPDYRISLQSIALGDSKPDILTGPAAPTALQTQKASGSDVLASSQTAQSWDANPALTFQLSSNGQSYALAAADNSTGSIAAAITAQYGDRVTATVVNLGTDETPDYRVSLTAITPGDVRPDILASDGISDPVSLQAQQQAGSDTRAVSQTADKWQATAGPVLSYQLSLGGVKYALHPADNSAAAVVSDINSRYGDKIQASVVDLGSPTAHDYRISLTAVGAGDLKPELIVAEASLQTQQATGAEARYVVNNSGREITTNTRSVSIANGITVSLLAKSPGAPVNITVSRSTSALSTALAAFASAYNAAVDEVDKQHGTSAGVLSGQSVLKQLSTVLSGMSTYAPSNSRVSNLAALGLDLDKTGHVTFNSFKLISADLINSSGVTAFLGSSSTGGFLKSANAALKSVEDSTSGLLVTARINVDTQIENLNQRIDDIQTRVDRMTERMQTQMAAMDALISSMEQQYSFLSGMFASMQAAGKQ